MSDIRDMIKTAFDGNASEFDDKFNSTMSDKMDAALAAKYDQMFGAEEVDETELDDEPEQELETD